MENNIASEDLHNTVLYFRDSRVHSWRWQPILEKWGHLKVLIDPEYLKTATFLIENGEPISTVFFVRVPLSTPSVPIGYDYYAVTTLHSIKDREVAIRFNLKQGGFQDKRINPNDWIPNPVQDIAILQVRFPFDEYDVKFIDTYEISKDKDYLISIEPPRHKTGAEADKTVLMRRYGVGDEVFSIGLFLSHYGEAIAQPAARFGHIALKPAAGEKILAEMEPNKWAPIDAFVVEITALPGQSGSPVFIRPQVRKEGDKPRTLWEYNFLIGMIQGFFPEEHQARLQVRNLKVTFNTGLGIVIPSQHIVEMLMEKSLVKKREERLRKIREEQANSRRKARMASISGSNKQGNIT